MENIFQRAIVNVRDWALKFFHTCVYGNIAKLDDIIIVQNGSFFDIQLVLVWQSYECGALRKRQRNGLAV